ncbi:HYR-like domain-containing protein, partial [Confluentibacter flavum]
MKKITFLKLYSLICIFLISSYTNADVFYTSSLPTYNLQYKIISFFVDLFSENTMKQNDDAKKYSNTKSSKLYHVTSSNLLTSTTFTVAADVTGDFRSIGSGDWDDPASWEVFNGATWDTATEYPGENIKTPPYPNVTIFTGHTITIDTNLTTENLGDVIIDGTLILGDGTSSQHITTLTTENLTISSSGILSFDGNKVHLTFPSANAAVLIDNGGTITGNCTNNDQIIINGEVYAACAGGGSGVYSFGEIVTAGGTLKAIISIPPSDPNTVCPGSTINFTGGFSGPDTNVNFTWTITDSSNNIISQSTGPTSGSLANETITTTGSFLPPSSDDYLLTLEIESPSITNIATRSFNVSDTTNPTASNPAPISVQCLADVPAPDVTVVDDEADNCGTPTVTFVSDSASPLVNDGTITRTYNVNDGNGNSINVTQTITIDDTTNP